MEEVSKIIQGSKGADSFLIIHFWRNIHFSSWELVYGCFGRVKERCETLGLRRSCGRRVYSGSSGNQGCILNVLKSWEFSCTWRTDVLERAWGAGRMTCPVQCSSLAGRGVRAEPHGNRRPLDFQLISAFESLGMLILPKQSSLC